MLIIIKANKIIVLIFKIIFMSLFKKASELEEKKAISVLIYGQPGAGKSTLGVSAPGTSGLCSTLMAVFVV